MAIKRRDFQKAAAFLHEFLLKLNEDLECAELRDTLNLALLHMQKYYRLLQIRSHEKNAEKTLSLTARGLSPMTPFVDAPDKFQWKWINLDSMKKLTATSVDDSINFTTLPPIIQAAKQGNLDLITDLIENDPDCIIEQDGIGRSAITYAVHFQQMDALHCLLDNQLDVNMAAHDGSTAIHQACHDANSLALSLMLQYGGDFTIQDTHGRAPIHWAVVTKSSECLKILIQHNADVNVRDKDGLSPSMWACRLDHIKHFEILSRSENFHVEEADGIERDLSGRTWMHWAIRRTEPLECLQKTEQQLERKKITLEGFEIVDKDHHFLVFCGEILEEQIIAKSSVVSERYGDEDLNIVLPLETLLTAETAMIRDEEGKTVLLLAAEMGSLASCKTIIEIGGNIRIHDRDYQDRSALHLASMGGHGEIINFLLDNGADLTVVDKFNGTAWEYARNRQLHYCQLIMMSHQRQRLASNPATPVPSGLGLSMMTNPNFMNGSVNGPLNFSMPASMNGSLYGGSTNGSVYGGSVYGGSVNGSMYGGYTGRTYDSEDFEHMINTRGSFDNPITPPHPPKRPRTSRHPVRRSQSLTNPDRDRAKEALQREENRNTNSAGGELQRRKERIEVSVDTRRTTGTYDIGSQGDVPMEDHQGQDNEMEDDIEGVSVGGMDVSDIEDENEYEPLPMPTRGPSQASSGSQFSQNSQLQPRPPPRYQPRPPNQQQQGQYAQPLEPQYHKQNIPDYARQDNKQTSRYNRQEPLPPKYPLNNQRVVSPHFKQNTNPSDSFPPGRPRPAPRQGQPPRPPPPRRTPSPNRPHSGSSDHVQSPPPSGSSDQTPSFKPSPPNPQDRRPDSGTHPPGVVEGRKIPPPMLTPLEYAPKLPKDVNLEKPEKERKKKKKKREREKEKDKEREGDIKSPPMDIEPPRGYAAPLHPPPSATQRQQRAQSGVPAPKFSKHTPQKHEPSRYIEESMDEEIKDYDDKPPIVNGHAVPIREGPGRSANPNNRLQPVDDEGEMEQVEGTIQDVIDEEEDVGPLIPPPQGFRSPSVRHHQGRPLSQSIPQDNRTARMTPITSAKPPLPRGRSSSSTGRSFGKSPSPARRSRPPTGRSNDSS